MAKGAGMLAPGLATMLVVITTDAVLDAAEADAALRARDAGDLRPARLRRMHVDERPGDAHGERARRASRPEPDDFAAALTEVCLDLATQLQGDAEGASHDISIEVVHAASEADAVEVGRSVARNNLFKAAIFGNDPNWGRVLAAIGTTDAEFDPYDVDVWMNGVRVCSGGGPDASARRRRPDPARDPHRDRPQGRRRVRDDPHERPHARLRPREQRLRVMTDIDLQDTDPAEASAKAATLIESLPWLQRFSDQIIVIKYGGNAMVSEELQDAFAADIAYLRYVGVKPVVVHGGGPQISSMLDRLAIPSEFKGGYRVTSTEAISVVRMVLTGQINPQLVAKINAHGPHATGLSAARTPACSAAAAAAWWSTASSTTSAASAMSSRSTRSRCTTSSRPAASRSSRASRPTSIIPGHSLNVNADAAAAALAVALGAAKLVVLTDVPGPLRRLAEPRLARLAPDRRRSCARCCRRSSRA